MSDFYNIVSRNVGQYTYSLNIPETVTRRRFDSSTGTWIQYQVPSPYPVEERLGIVPFNKGATITTDIKVRGAVIVNWGVNGSVNRTLTMNLFNGETTKTSNGVKFSFNTSTSKLTMTNVSTTNYNQANFEIGTIDARSILGIIVTPTDKTLTTYNDIEDISYTCDGQTYNVNVADFSNCNNLEYLSPTIFSNSNHIITLDGCFANCTSLVSMPVLPAGVKKMYQCFSGCTSLVEVPVGSIPNGVEDMAYCFYNCSSLTHAYLPDGVLYIDYCFRNCLLLSALPSVPNSVVSMGGYYKSSPMTSPPALPNKVINISDCFSNCNSLLHAPVIPTTVKNIEECFRGCVALKGDIYIYTDNLANISNCFMGTTQSITLHAMNNNVDICEQLASTATNNNVYINTTPTTLPSTIECTPMNYMTDNRLVQLSPQTDASLVSVQVPHGSGTITTTLEDALVDLYQRVGDV